MSSRTALPRRTFLRGMGTAMALPWLDAMLPNSIIPAAQAATGAAPVRMAFIFFPNGAIVPSWKPEGNENDWKL